MAEQFPLQNSPLLCRAPPHHFDDYNSFVPDAPGWQFYHPTSRRVFPSQDVTFDESVPFYRLFPYRTAQLPPPPLFLTPGAPPIDPLPPQGPAPSGVSQVDTVEPVEVAVDSGPERGTEPWGTETGGAEPGGAATGGAEPEGAETEGAETGGAETGGAEPGGAESGGAEPWGAATCGVDPGGAPSSQQLREWYSQRCGLRCGATRAASTVLRPEPPSPQRLREWYARRCSLRSGAPSFELPPAGGPAATGGTAGAAGRPGVAGGAAGAAGGTGVAAGAAGGTGAAGGAAGTGPAGGAAGATGGPGVADGAAGAARDTGAAGAPSGAPGPVTGGCEDLGSIHPVREQVVVAVAAVPVTVGWGPCRALVAEHGKRCEASMYLASKHSWHKPSYSHSGAAGAGATGGTGVDTPGGATGAAGVGAAAMGSGALSAGSGGTSQPRPFFVPLRQQLQPTSPLPGPSPYTGPTGGLTERREPESRPVSPESRSTSPVRAARPGRRVPRQRPPAVPGTHQMLLRLSTAPQRVPLPSPPASSLPALADQESDSLRAASPTVTRLLSTVVTDPSFESAAASALVTELVDFAAHYPDAPDIPTPRSYAEAIASEYSSQWQTAMDAEMASRKSTGTYVDEVPPPGANIVSGMWIFRVKRPPGSPPVFKARYVARGFSQREGVDFFQTFSPTPKMTTLRVMLHVAAQRNYELHSLDLSTAFLQGSLHKEIWLRSSPSFTGSFPPVARHTEDYTCGSWVLVFYCRPVAVSAHRHFTAAVLHPRLQKRHTCTDLGELTSYLGLRITRDIARRTITLTQSHMVQQVLQRFGFTWSSAHATPLAIGHSLSALPSDESVEPSGSYPELVGCLMHRKVHWDAAKRVLHYMCSTSGMGLVLGGRRSVFLTGHSDASWVDDQATQRSSHGYTFSLGSGSVSWRSTCSSSVLSSSCEAEIYATAMAAQELRWLTYLLTDLGERPSSPPVLYVDNKAAIALCQEHSLEHRTKHIALRYFLAREL
ncbi:unnamed protein product [Closterium sp. NIES-54]